MSKKKKWLTTKTNMKATYKFIPKKEVDKTNSFAMGLNLPLNYPL
jgi:hypothetical protein